MSNFLIFLGAMISCYLASFKVFAWFEDRLAPDRKRDITNLLKSADAFAENKVFASSMEKFHNGLFGDNHFSIKCVISTFIFSVLSLFLVVFAFLVSDTGHELFVYYYDVVATWLGALLTLFAFISFPVDYIGVYVTRRFIKWLGGGVSITRAAGVFLLELTIKGVALPFISFTSIYVLLSILSGQILSNLVVLEVVDDAFYLVSVYVLFYLCIANIICSILAWLYLTSLYIVRATVFLFDVDKEPVRSIGIVGSAVLTACYGGYILTTSYWLRSG